MVHPREYKVGDRVLVSLSSGRIVEAVVKAVIQQGDERRLQVDYGRNETALSSYARSVLKFAESDAVVATLLAPPLTVPSKGQV